MQRLTIMLMTCVMLLAACGGEEEPNSSNMGMHHKTDIAENPAPATGSSGSNIYEQAGANMLVDATKNAPYRIYVPNSDERSVTVIDPAQMKAIETFRVGQTPQHVVPAWDLTRLYATNNASNSLTPIDPMTGKRAGDDIAVEDPYNMYFTPDGKFAIVVAEALENLDFRDPHTFELRNRVHVDCPGVDHIDFAADNSYFIATCEFSGKLVKVSLLDQKVVGYLTLDPQAMPQDIKLEPAGKMFYVADMASDGVWQIDGESFTNVGFLETGPEAHGLYPSRDAKYLYVSNRGGQKMRGDATQDEGSVTVIDFASRQIVKRWPIPAPSTPDMGGVSPDGSVLWLAGRRSEEVYAIDTDDGHLIARIPVGKGPHGLCVWPQPGRYSLGHTGILR